MTGSRSALAALQVFVRDVEHVLMPVLMILMYLTPILYPLSLVPESMRPWVAANPFGYLVDRLRDALLDGSARVRDGGAVVASRCLAALGVRAVADFETSREAALRVFRRISSPHFEDFRLTCRGLRCAMLTRRRRQGLREGRRRGGRVRLVFDLLRGRGAAHVFRALDDVSFDLAARRVARHHRRERRRQVDAAEDRRRRDHADARHASHVRGRVGALLELGSGFHPEYTGLDNIDLAAALLGLVARGDRAPSATRSSRSPTSASTSTSRSSTTRRAWSCGSGFAVATALTPDILITDEVLAVGDESFQKKCIAWMESYLRGGGTLLLCSHSMYPRAEALPQRAVARDGRVERYGDARRRDAGVSRVPRGEGRAGAERQPVARAGRGRRASTRSQSLDDRARRNDRAGRGLVVSGEAHSPDGRAPVVLHRHRARRRHAGLRRQPPTWIGVVADPHRTRPVRVHADAADRSRCCPGKYLVRAHALDPEGVRIFDNVEREFVVSGESRELGLVALPHRWHDGVLR